MALLPRITNYSFFSVIVVSSIHPIQISFIFFAITYLYVFILYQPGLFLRLSSLLLCNGILKFIQDYIIHHCYNYLHIRLWASWEQIYVIFILTCLIVRSSVILWKGRKEKGKENYHYFFLYSWMAANSIPTIPGQHPLILQGSAQMVLSQRLSLTTSKKCQQLHSGSIFLLNCINSI